ncbi:MAG TPA: hypothetical protein VE959_14175 [Bryobacteraceae bacterium]|nr:hypothetical protein [Bryobacteraceae bacterium]
MTTARLVLKQPTGWFAAGREVAQALALLSDGAFKLYIHLCLEADRHTGQAAIGHAELTRILRKDAVSIEADLGELHGRGVCERHQDRVEICDRFWPYQKLAAKAAGSPEVEFVRQARQAFLEPACVRSAFTAADEKLALDLCRRGVSLEQLRRAIWLGCARKYTAMLNGQTRLPIASLSYFACLTDEVMQPQIPASYWEHVRRKTEEMEKRWLQIRTSVPAMIAVPANPSPPETA